MKRLIFFQSLLAAAAAVVAFASSAHSAGTFDSLYDFNNTATLGTAAQNQRRITIPRKNGVEVPVIKVVICSYPGIGGTGNAGSPPDSVARWAYDNGIAYYSVGLTDTDPAETIADLTAFADNLGRPSLANAPIIVTGGSSGFNTAKNVAAAYPARVLALYGYHKGYTSEPIFAQSVPAHISFGEFDSARSDYNNKCHLKYLASDFAAQGGAPRAIQFDRGVNHTEIPDRASHFQLFVDSMIPLRYPYQQGVSGKDPALGTVTLTAVNLAAGWRGEHLLTPALPAAAADYLNPLPYALRSKDWDSANLKIAPAAQFDRSNTNLHSWFPDDKLACAWRSRAGLGASQMRITFDATPNPDAADNSVRPPVFNTDQTLGCSLDPGAFASASRVEFYDNSTLVKNAKSGPFAHTYAWAPGAEGWHVLYAVAVDDATGERRVSGCRIVRVTPKQVAANTAPTISKIAEKTVVAGTTNLSIPFTIGDAESSTLNLLYVKESSLDDANPNDATLIAHAGTFSGSGANRTLNITITDTAKTGKIWGVVQVNDGDLQANAYVQINIVPASPQPPIFVDAHSINSATGDTPGLVLFKDGWSREISFRVHDADTAPENLIVTATSNKQSSIPDSNIIVGGYGETRTLKIRPIGTAYTTITITVSDGTNSTTQTWSPTPDAAFVSYPPILNNIPDTATYVGEAASVMVRAFDPSTSSEAQSGFIPLSVTATSSNQTLLPNANITVASAGAERRITCQPASGLTGQATVTVTVTNEKNLTATDTFVLTVGAAATPAITSQPESTLIVSGGAASLSASATGGNPKTYQWYLGASGNTSSPVSGATSATLSVSNVTTSASYWVQVSNAAGSADSSAANISVVHPPAITTHPAPVPIYPGQTAAFSVSATGEQLSYQWYAGNSGDTGTPVAGATAASFTSPALSTTTKYWVRVSNLAGTADSIAGTASIAVRSWVAYHDTNTTVGGNAANVTTSAVATTPGASTSLLNFQTGDSTGVTLNALLTGTKSAKTNGTTAPTAGTDAYNAFNGIISFTGNHSEQLGGNVTTSNVLFTFSGLDPSMRYSIAFYAARNAFTTPNRVTISAADSFQEGHSNGVGNAGDGDPATADVASGTGSTTNGYLVKWFDIAPGSDGSFAVEIRTHTGTSFAIIPQAVMLEAFTNTPPAAEIITQPQGSTIAYNATAGLSVTASGTGMTYQWYQGASGDTSAPADGATSASFTTPALTANASFWVRITNAGGTVDSQSATINVNPPLRSPLQAWSDGYSLGGPDAEWNADPDGDGIGNLVEFALGGNPASSSVAPRPAVDAPAAETLAITFRRATAGVRYIVESSTTLAQGSWIAEATIEKNADPASVGQDVSVEVPMGTDARKFLRIRVEE